MDYRVLVAFCDGNRLDPGEVLAARGPIQSKTSGNSCAETTSRCAPKKVTTPSSTPAAKQGTTYWLPSNASHPYPLLRSRVITFADWYLRSHRFRLGASGT